MGLARNAGHLEREAQRELHLARRAELAAQPAESGGGGQAGIARRRVESDGVGEVVRFPAELQLLLLAPGHGETLGNGGIDIEVAVAAQRDRKSTRLNFSHL